MVWNIVKNMFDNTDEKGVLIIKGWNVDPEETNSNPRFYKCFMNWKWEDMDSIAEEATLLCGILETIGRYCAENGLDINCEPDFEAVFDEEDAEEYREVWEMFFGGYDFDSIGEDKLKELAEQRLGRTVNAYNVFMRARRLVRLIMLGAPEFIINNERYELVRAIVLNCACEEMTYVDISKDRFDEKTVTLGEFNEDDINRIFDMLMTNCSVMPEERMGYTLLLNMVFGDIRVDLYRRYDELKPAVDAALGTLTYTERTVLEKLYGLTDGVRRSHEMTALEMSVPKPVIEWYEYVTMRKLRHPNRASKLKKAFDEPEDNDGMTELGAFNTDVRLAEFRARRENGELTEEEQATLDLLTAPLPDDLKELFGC